MEYKRKSIVYSVWRMAGIQIRTLYSSLHTRYSILHTRRASRGVTLIDVVVGTALMLIVFLGIAGAFKLSIEVVTNNKARAGAVALANERMEYIRSLAYASVGTVGGVPSGAIAQSETAALNGVTYTRRTVVEYVDDVGDGLGAADTNGITIDYKVAKAEISWVSRAGTRFFTLVTRVSPPNGMEAACSPSAQCGTLTINVLNAALQPQPVSNAQVHIVNTTTNPGIDITTYTNIEGVVSIVGAPAAAGYQVTVTKAGYSTDKTYDVTAQNTDPTPGHLTVSSNQTTTGTFRIDLLGSITINTYSLSTNSWNDTFSNESKIDMVNSTYIEVSGNQVRFAGNQPWTNPADLYSQAITPAVLSRWGTFSWNDNRPSETTITYRVYHTEDNDPELVPDSVLPGNSAGFSTGTSIDVSGIPADEYPSIILGAHLVALNPSAPSPTIQDWTLTYDSGQATAMPMNMRGIKTVGSGPGGIIYKYDQTLNTNSSGTLLVSSLEWDTYTMTVAESTGYDISSSCLPQPTVLPPNSSVTTHLFLSPHSSNNLLVDVKNSAGVSLSGSSVRLTKGGSYDKTLFANACGQAFFDTLTNGNYSISVSKSGYATYDASGIDVTGRTRLSVVLN